MENKGKIWVTELSLLDIEEHATVLIHTECLYGPKNRGEDNYLAMLDRFTDTFGVQDAGD